MLYLGVDGVRLSVDPPFLLDPLLDKSYHRLREVAAEDAALPKHFGLDPALQFRCNDTRTAAIVEQLERLRRAFIQSDLVQHLCDERHADALGVVEEDILPGSADGAGEVLEELVEFLCALCGSHDAGEQNGGLLRWKNCNSFLVKENSLMQIIGVVFNSSISMLKASFPDIYGLGRCAGGSSESFREVAG